MGLRSDILGSVRPLREAAGLSLRQLAKRLKVSHQGLADLESGRTGEFLDSIERTIEALGGAVVGVVLPPALAGRAPMLHRLAEMHPDDAAVRLRLLDALDELPPAEQEMIAIMAEVRAAAISRERPAGARRTG